MLIAIADEPSWKFGWDFAAVTAITMGLYTWFTVQTTAWRTKFRKEANAADNKGATVAVDSLINFEAVKVGLCREFYRTSTDMPGVQQREIRSCAI